MALRIDAGGEPIPGYRLVRLLGEGGFGQVWEAEAPGRIRVALKFIRLDNGRSDPELRALDIIREIRHPHLLDVQFATQVEDRLIIAMPLCDRSLLDRLKECKAQGLLGVPVDELLEYMQDAARALDFLNESRHPGPEGIRIAVAHRDIKPHNIFLVGGSVKLADFGLVKALENSVASHTGSMTPAYAPPEMFSKQVFPQSDQWSLAVSYYQLRTGVLPFTGTIHQIIASILRSEPELNLLPPEERAVIARALEKDPHLRWPNCRQFAAELTAAVKAAVPIAEANPLTNVPVDSSQTTPLAMPPSESEMAGGDHYGTIRPNAPPPAEAERVTQLPHETVVPEAQSASHAAQGSGCSYQTIGTPASETDDPPPPDPSIHSAITLKPLIPAGETDLSAPAPVRLSKSRAPRPRTRRRKSLLVGGGLFLLLAAVAFYFLQSRGPEVVENSIGMELVTIPAGEFEMGSPAEDEVNLDVGDDGHANAAHHARITKPFAMGRTEVTQGQWEQVMGTTPWKDAPFVRENSENAASHVSHDEALAFCGKLTELERNAGRLPPGALYRLPTEAEWEYACRAGSKTRFSFGDSDDELHEYAWYAKNSWDARESHAHAAGQKRANAWGLCDMHGNVNEWCMDWWGPYPSEAVSDPVGPAEGTERVLRGGSFFNSPEQLESGRRNKAYPENRSHDLGFRVVLTIPLGND